MFRQFRPEKAHVLLAPRGDRKAPAKNQQRVFGMERSAYGKVERPVHAAGEQLRRHQALQAHRGDAEAARFRSLELERARQAPELSADWPEGAQAGQAAGVLGLVQRGRPQLPGARHGPVRVWQLLRGVRNENADCQAQDQAELH